MRKGFLGSLAALLTWSGLALGQGYYPGYYPGAYPTPVQQTWPGQALPMYPQAGMMPPPVLQGLPQGYAQPYYPQSPSYNPPPPVVHGWPPPPGSMPPSPGTVAPKNAAPAKVAAQKPAAQKPAAEPTPKNASAQGVQLADRKTTDGKTGESGTRLVSNNSTVSYLSPVQPAGVSDPVKGQPVHWNKNPQAGCSTCGPSYPAAALDPAPGTPLMCGDHGCDPCQPCLVCGPTHDCQPPCLAPRGYRGYAQAEFLYWWLTSRESPALLNIPTANGGQTQLSANDLAGNEHVGGRLTLGRWLNFHQDLALEGSFLYLNERTTSRSGGGSPISYPFFDLANNIENTLLVPPAAAFNLSALTRLFGAEANLRWQVCRSCWGHLDLLGGIRYLELDETLDLTTTSTTVPGNGNGNGNGTPIFTSDPDHFGTRNTFWGGQIGLEGEINWRCFFVNAYGKIAFGCNRERINIDGYRTFNDPNTGVTTLPGGFFAEPSNMGNYRHDKFTILPDAGIRAGLKCSNHVRFSLGYSFLYLRDVVRPGNQIDRNINLTQQTALPNAPPNVLTGPLGPLFTLNTSSVWAQGINAALEIRY